MSFTASTTRRTSPTERLHSRPGTRQDRSLAQEPPSTSSESRLSRIAKRAHEIYEARGGEDGKAMEDWLQAEREIDGQIEAESSRGK
jgi:hypothetical protein